MSVSYRKWTERDLGPIRDVMLKTWLDAYVSFVPESDLRWYLDHHYDDAGMRKLYEDQDINGIVAVSGGRVVGFVRTRFRADEHRHYVSSLYILPEYQNQGIGRTLMKMAADEALLRNVDCVWLGVMVENHSAVDWYKAMGFVVVDEEPFTMGRTTVNHYIGYVPVSSIKKSKKSSQPGISEVS